MLTSVVAAIFTISSLVLFHELGHFCAAKWCNVKVEKFSLGFGPALFRYSRGETEYLLSLVPLGGYVKMMGESPEDQAIDSTRSFSNKSPYQKILIALAGPLANFIFAWLVLIAVYCIGIPGASPEIGQVEIGSPAAAAGLQSGDIIRSINGKNVKVWQHIARGIAECSGKLNIVVERKSKLMHLELTPKKISGRTIFGEPRMVGYAGIKSTSNNVIAAYTFSEAIAKSSTTTYEVTEMVVASFAKLFQRVVPVEELGGPIMIFNAAAGSAKDGGVSFLLFLAAISINLGVMNLIPLPVLDGGHIVIHLVEIVTGRTLGERVLKVFQFAGLGFILAITALAFYNDINRYFL